MFLMDASLYLSVAVISLSGSVFSSVNPPVGSFPSPHLDVFSSQHAGAANLYKPPAMTRVSTHTLQVNVVGWCRRNKLRKSSPTRLGAGFASRENLWALF